MSRSFNNDVSMYIDEGTNNPLKIKSTEQACPYLSKYSIIFVSCAM